MAVAVASFSSFGGVDGGGDNSITITKPTGLAVGDLMVAVLCSVGASWSTASGWTEVFDDTRGTSTTCVQYKIADSADVAASNFTFNTSGSVTKSGGIYRITGYGPATFQSTTGGKINSTAGTVSITGITPTHSDSLYILVATHTKDSGTTPIALSGWAFATDDPSWTEQFDVNDGGFFTFGSASAIRSAVTATGDISVTLTNQSATSDVSLGLLVVTPAVNDTDTPSALTVYADVMDVFHPVKVSANVPAPTSIGETTPKWSTNDKTSSTWINLDKS